MSNFFERPRFPVKLPDGRECRIRGVGGIEYAEAQAAQASGDTQTMRTARFYATLCYYGIVDPKPESVEQVGSTLTLEELIYIGDRIGFRSDVVDDDPDAPAVDKESVEREEVGEDPLVEEFPADGDAAVADVGESAGAVQGVPLPAEPVADGDAGGVPDDGGGEPREVAAGEAAAG